MTKIVLVGRNLCLPGSIVSVRCGSVMHETPCHVERGEGEGGEGDSDGFSRITLTLHSSTQWWVTEQTSHTSPPSPRHVASACLFSFCHLTHAALCRRVARSGLMVQVIRETAASVAWPLFALTDAAAVKDGKRKVPRVLGPLTRGTLLAAVRAMNAPDDAALGAGAVGIAATAFAPGRSAEALADVVEVAGAKGVAKILRAHNVHRFHLNVQRVVGTYDWTFILARVTRVVFMLNTRKKMLGSVGVFAFTVGAVDVLAPAALVALGSRAVPELTKLKMRDNVFTLWRCAGLADLTSRFILGDMCRFWG